MAVIATLAVTAACGRSTGSSSPEPVDTSSDGSGKSARDLLPADLKKSGVLKVATAEGYPPMEMYAEGSSSKLVGVDPELGELIADQLGLEFEITNAAFPGLIPGLQSDQWDLAMSSMSDTEERRQAVNFVDYFNAGGAIMVSKGNPEGIEDIADLCGKKIVGAKGSSNLAILTDYNDSKCTDKMSISESEDAPTGLLQLDTGRSVATMVDYPVAVLLAEQSGKYEVLEGQYGAGPWGIAIDKADTALTQAVQAALTELIDNGKYLALLEKYGVADSAVETATINAGS
ncbi:ABC transporter substrate-binding protein [Nocardioides sp. R1-1]|uniref:ABC transporter substrate-binding protein n=1 Tax=Nocardioides sp. R1-1 TaxID=3383502 RepID=UPI0038D1E08C